MSETWPIEYTESLEGVAPEHLHGFFVGWRNPPSPETQLAILRGSDQVVLARDGERVVGFVTAISDGVLSAFVPLLEVLPEYQGQGIGSELVRRLLARLESIPNVDLTCDAGLEPFYKRFGLLTFERAMGLRR